jgi:hypothetical protein
MSTDMDAKLKELQKNNSIRYKNNALRAIQFCGRCRKKA